MHRLVRQGVAVLAFASLSGVFAAVISGGDRALFMSGFFLLLVLFGIIFLLAGLAQWSQLGLRAYGTMQGDPWGAHLAAYGAPGLRRTSLLGPPLPWEGRKDASGRLVVFTTMDGLVIGGLLLLVAFVVAFFSI